MALLLKGCWKLYWKVDSACIRLVAPCYCQLTLSTYYRTHSMLAVYQDRADGILENGIYKIISLVMRTWSRNKYSISTNIQTLLNSETEKERKYRVEHTLLTIKIWKGIFLMQNNEWLMRRVSFNIVRIVVWHPVEGHRSDKNMLVNNNVCWNIFYQCAYVDLLH